MSNVIFCDSLKLYFFVLLKRNRIHSKSISEVHETRPYRARRQY
jgi:hypothetical protein